eukprot:TRINITY_DN15853_c0_g1_i1.p1 TRINITY_DN15853_c0_g1~~TRINITY_DN15853_c0_g1_i1.p1  ORF type:complete len:181 (+),score=41.67 TRINITY_DN15853_c0_g1_i1:56-544(+)
MCIRDSLEGTEIIVEQSDTKTGSSNTIKTSLGYAEASQYIFSSIQVPVYVMNFDGMTGVLNIEEGKTHSLEAFTKAGEANLFTNIDINGECGKALASLFGGFENRTYQITINRVYLWRLIWFDAAPTGGQVSRTFEFKPNDIPVLQKCLTNKDILDLVGQQL